MAVQTKSKTIGTYLLDQLKANGVDHIFGIPGDYILPFDKMIENHTIRFINTTRENTAGFMADAYARMRGLGVACITYGVGINILNAAAQAFVESSPLIIISGAVSSQEFIKSQRLHHLFNKDHSGPRDTIQLEMFRKITVAQAVLDDPNTAAGEIDRVISACLLHKKPVYIEMPKDQAAAPIAAHHFQESLPKKSDPQALNEASIEVQSILKNCSRPVIWVGHEVMRHSLEDHVLKFAETHHIPIVTSLLGKSTISEYHPLFVGLYQGRVSREEVAAYVENCDCMFLFGVILNDVDTGIFTVDLANKQTIIANSELISINHHQYKEVSFFDFVNNLGNLELNVRFRSEYPANIDRPMRSFSPKKGQKITSKRLFECLQKHLTPNNIIVSDFGDCLFGSGDLTVDHHSFISNAYFATLGFGVPGAIGAQLAVPERRVIGVVGDGAFQMTCMELSTAVRYGADPVIILLNNHGYATERPLLEGKFNDIGNWNYSELPKVLQKGIGKHVKTEEEFEQALIKALEVRGEYHLIEVELDKHDYSPALHRFCNLVNAKKQ